MRVKLIVDIISFLFIFLFIYAAVSKLIEFSEFNVQLLRSPVLTTVAGFTSYAVPISEIIIAVMLVVPRMRYAGLLASYLLMVAFTTYIVLILRFSFYVPRSCGGVLESLGWSEHFIFNIVFVCMGVVGTLLQAKIVSEERKQFTT